MLNNSKKRVLKEIAFHILERTKYPFEPEYEQWYLFVLDIIDTKFHKEEKKPERTPPKNVYVIDFVNKGIDAIHLPKIFHSAEVVKLLPEKLRENDSIPFAAFKLQRPIRSKIFNYRQTVMDMDFQHDEEVGFSKK